MVPQTNEKCLYIMFCSVEAKTKGGLTEDDLALLNSPGIIEHFYWVY